MLRSTLKCCLRLLLGDYELYEVWHAPSPAPMLPLPRACSVRAIDEAALRSAGNAALHEALWYLGEQSQGYGLYCGDELTAIAFYWHGARYASRRSWPLDAHAAKLVHLVTAPTARGKGHAAALIAATVPRMAEEGFDSLFARIWHSNEPSKRAFARAGWQRVGHMISINPVRLRHAWTLRWRHTA